MNGCNAQEGQFQFYEKITKVTILSCIFISLFTKKYQVAASRNRKFNSNFVSGQTWIIVKVCVSRNLDFVARRTQRMTKAAIFGRSRIIGYGKIRPLADYRS